MVASLYESDFYAWTGDQAARLRQLAAERVNLDLDWDNLAEEIECMGKSERHEISNRLIELLFHLSKLTWSPDRNPRADWRVSVLNQRDGIEDRINGSPSLAHYPSEILPKCWEKARRRTANALNIAINTLPAACPWNLEHQILNDDWLPAEPTEQA